MGSEAPPLTGCVTMGRSLHLHTPGSRNLAHGGCPEATVPMCALGWSKRPPHSTRNSGLGWASSDRYLHPSPLPGHEIC